MKKRRRFCPNCKGVVKLGVEKKGRNHVVVCPKCDFREEFRGYKKKVKYLKVDDYVPKNN